MTEQAENSCQWDGDSIRSRYESHYVERISAFIRDIGEINASGLPEVHLPLWGKNYETAPMRIAVIGRDTKYWGSMEEFLNVARRDPQNAVSRSEAIKFRGEAPFRDLPFTKTNNFGTSFWDTAMQFLALFHNVPDWKRLKRRQHDDILQSFVWAETNTVERWDASPSEEGADFESWRKVKIAAEENLDSFSAVIDIFRPHIAVVMNWGVSDEYWDCSLQWQPLTTHLRYAFAPSTETHVFHTRHPNRMPSSERSAIFAAVRQKWETVRSLG